MPDETAELTVGDVRKAIADLPDSAPLQPVWTEGPPGDDSPAVGIDFFRPAEDAEGKFLSVGVSLHDLDEYEGDEEDDEDDEDDDPGRSDGRVGEIDFNRVGRHALQNDDEGDEDDDD